MNLLAFDTGTENLSIGVARTVDGQTRQWLHSAPGGARASTDLIPAILDQLQQAGVRLQALDAICFGAGPGSFTGLRTACSVAQGLALGAGVAVLPMDSLLAVAEDARHIAWPHQPEGVVTALLDARMDELYSATWAWDVHGHWRVLQPSALVRPENVARPDGLPASTPWRLAGNVFAAYGERVGANDPAGTSAMRVAAQPTASAMLRLAGPMVAAGHTVPPDQAWPHYIRDKVAKTTAERLADKAAAGAGRPG